MKNFKFFSMILFVFVLIFVLSFNCFSLSISDYAPIDDVIVNDFSNDIATDIKSSPSLLLLSGANYPDFKPNLIPWETTPQYIQDILYNTPFISTDSLSYVDPWKIPFCVVITNGTIARVIVGINLSLGTYVASADNLNPFSPTGTYVVCEVLDGSGNVKTGIEYACCYEALYSLETMKTTVDWHSLSPIALGNRFSRFTNSILLPSTNWDFYCYGGNNIGPGKTSSITSVFTNADWGKIYAVSNNNYGFAGNSFIYKPDAYPSAYFKSFVPSTYEEKELETQKGILSNVKNVWDAVKDLPNTIGEKLKSLFIPDEDFFSDYFNNLQTFFSEKLGFLVYPFDFIITFLNKYIDIGEGSGVLHIPNFEIMDVTIFNEVDFNLKDAMSSFLGEYYNIYFAFVDFIILVGLVNLALKKFNSMSGGNDE